MNIKNKTVEIEIFKKNLKMLFGMKKIVGQDIKKMD